MRKARFTEEQIVGDHPQGGSRSGFGGGEAGTGSASRRSRLGASGSAALGRTTSAPEAARGRECAV